MTPKTFHALFGRIGARAKMPFPIHPHMLRHGCGYALANAGHDTRALQAYLGHKNIQHTVRYSELSPERFRVLEGLSDALPRSKATSNAKGSHRNLGGLGSDRNGAAVAGPHREGEEP
jgi:site-specific recombinase XerC